MNSNTTQTNYHGRTGTNEQGYPRLAAVDPKPVNGDGFPDFVPLADIQLPEFRVYDIFEGWLANMISEVAHATQTPPELAASFGLAAVATAVAKRFEVKVQEGHTEQLCLFTLCALPSGSRKSAVLKLMQRPLLDWERRAALDVQPRIKQAESKGETTKTRIAALRKEASKKDGAEFQAICEQIEKLESDIGEIPVVPRLVADDITPEHLGTLMQKHGERMAIFSDEGGFFETIGGRYNDGIANIDMILKSFTGTAARVDRGSRDPVFLDEPALTISIAPQPSVLQALVKNHVFKGRGLVARFLYMVPKSTVGWRTCDTQPCSDETKRGYARGIDSLLNIQPTPDKQPRCLTLDAGALACWQEFFYKIESDMRPGERFCHMNDWASKLPGLVARIAGLLHCAAYASDVTSAMEICQDTMERAVRLGNIAIDHGMLAYGLTSGDPVAEVAKTLWATMKAQTKDAGGHREISKRDAWHPNKGAEALNDMDKAEPGFKLLIQNGYIRELERERGKKGRPPVMYRLNPAAIAHDSQSTN